MTGHELLTTSEMARADKLAVVAGIPSLVLMENAGRAVADEVGRLASGGSTIVVLCGPGNNGGDGFVAARLLKRRGFTVQVSLLGTREALKGDAATMAAQWEGEVLPPDAQSLANANIVVDALFGAGLTRPLDGEAAALVGALNSAGKTCVAVDVPSGLDGNTGSGCGGPVVAATRTVTFFRRKPGHLLMPGRKLCGPVSVADIGIPASVLDDIAPLYAVNDPAAWLRQFPWPSDDGHKYDRGHALVVSGPAHATGAARLGARAALRMGAGLVTVASPLDAVTVNAAHLTAIMLKPFDGTAGFQSILADKRKNAVLIGPGCGVGDNTRELVSAVLASAAAAVLDADALTSFAGDDVALAAACKLRPAPVVVTPHEGEFVRLAGARVGSKLERAIQFAQAFGCIVVLKGPDSVIAAPDGRALVNEHAPAWLATAGSGDVLAGLIVALLAQGMPPLEAAAAAVWLHGECARRHGPGLIAEDLPEAVPSVLAELWEHRDGLELEA